MIEPLVDIEVSAAIAALPKADIHVHAEAYPRLERLRADAGAVEATDWRALDVELMRTRPRGISRLVAWDEKRRISRDELLALDSDPAMFVRRVASLLEDEARDGSIYVEALFGGATITRPDFLELFGDALATVRESHPAFDAVALVAADCSRDWAERMLPLCLDGARCGLAGINIIPNPFDQPADWTAVCDWAERAGDAGLGIAAHGGELDHLHLQEAVEVPGLTRIGHAVVAAADPRMLERIAEQRITIESSLSCNVVLGAVTSYEAHPIRAFVERGIPVALCSDDPIRAWTGIGREYAIAALLGFTADELLGFTRNAVTASFCPPSTRQRLLGIVGDAG